MCMLQGQCQCAKATASLQDYFAHIVHAVPPMYTSPQWETLLSNCWKAALEQAWHCATSSTSPFRIASPLLGAGARGAPVEEACGMLGRVGCIRGHLCARCMRHPKWQYGPSLTSQTTHLPKDSCKILCQSEPAPCMLKTRDASSKIHTSCLEFDQ
ncbi:unnamed protein product [Effrenium voratum]|uniref:Macro domain-containing protein n=1 Tax=Effrenium voratum TaxID=2562239 RepID=A0AA36HPG8_9DINO|nr:unnamed protein product [Effrenium voratum]